MDNCRTTSSKLFPDIKFSDIINSKSRLCESKNIKAGQWSFRNTLLYFQFKEFPLFNCIPTTSRNITKCSFLNISFFWISCSNLFD